MQEFPNQSLFLLSEINFVITDNFLILRIFIF